MKFSKSMFISTKNQIHATDDTYFIRRQMCEDLVNIILEKVKYAFNEHPVDLTTQTKEYSVDVMILTKKEYTELIRDIARRQEIGYPLSF